MPDSSKNVEYATLILTENVNQSVVFIVAVINLIFAISDYEFANIHTYFFRGHLS